ncbi:MAG: S24 family peptidase [Bacillota bacterium]
MAAERKNTGSIALGRLLAAKRLSSGMSYRELSAKIGKAPSTIQSWEQAKRMPDIDDLFVLAEVFDTDLNELVTLAVPPAKELERRLAAAEDRYRKAAREASRKAEAGDSGAGPALLAARREIAFLRNLITHRKKQDQPHRLPPRAVPLYDLKRVPVIGSIRAGQPRLAFEEALGYTGVPHDVSVDYALTVDGDSMVGAGIAPGDIVWVKRADSGSPGDTVVALLEGREVTVKHLLKEGGRYILRANNPDREYPDIPLGPEDRIIGIVQRVVKRPAPPPR